MSTNAILAVRTEAGVVGRYLHSDGYPDHVVPNLERMIERDGGAKVAETLLAADRGGWSSINDSQGPFENDYKRGVEGYGNVYTDDERSEPSRWELAVPDACIEYGYILDPESGDLEAYDLHGGTEKKISLEEYLAVDSGE